MAQAAHEPMLPDPGWRQVCPDAHRRHQFHFGRVAFAPPGQIRFCPARHHPPARTGSPPFGKVLSNSLDDFKPTRPGAPSLDPGFRIADGQHHQLLVNQIVPIGVLARPVPSAKHRVNVGLEVERKFLPPNVEIFFHNLGVFKVAIIGLGAIPTV